MRQSMRKTSLYIIFGIICVLLFTGCTSGGGNGGPDSDDDDDMSGGVNSRIYYGTADVIIDYYDYDFSGSLIFIEQKAFQYDVEIITGPPKNVGSVYEQNSINLQIGSINMGGEGSFGISSAILNVALQGLPVLLEYWDLTIGNNLLEGTLTDTHIAESAAANQIYAWEDFAGYVSIVLFYMDTGTTINGSLSDNIADIQIGGQTTDGTRVFAIDIQAQR